MPAHGHGEVDELVLGVGGHVERQGTGVLAREVERRAVRHHAAAGAERDLAQRKRGLVGHDVRPTPGVRRRLAYATFEQPFDPAVLLLEMLLLEEHALRPDDTARRRHCYFFSTSMISDFAPASMRSRPFWPACTGVELRHAACSTSRKPPITARNCTSGGYSRVTERVAPGCSSSSSCLTRSAASSWASFS